MILEFNEYLDSLEKEVNTKLPYKINQNILSQ